MKIDKKMVSLGLGLASLVPLVIYAASTSKKKHTKKKPKSFEIDENTQWVLDCLDEMIVDLKQMHKQQEEQEKRLAQVEVRIDNVNNRVDSVVGGK